MTGCPANDEGKEGNSETVDRRIERLLDGRQPSVNKISRKRNCFQAHKIRKKKKYLELNPFKEKIRMKYQ